MIVEYRLYCRHQYAGRMEDLEKYMPCNECSARTKLLAVECREWRLACNQCTYARWCGASRSEGVVLANAHARRTLHSDMRLFYSIQPDKRALLKKMFTHRVFPVIVVAKSWSVDRVNREGEPVTGAKLPAEPLPDDPPY